MCARQIYTKFSVKQDDIQLSDIYIQITLIKEYKSYMAKKLVRLTEGDLHRIIKESVNKVLRREEKHLVKEDLSSMVKDEERKTNAYAFMALKRLSYLVHEEMRPLIDNSTPELMKICNEMATIIDEAIGTHNYEYKYSPIPSKDDFFQKY